MPKPPAHLPAELVETHPGPSIASGQAEGRRWGLSAAEQDGAPLRKNRIPLLIGLTALILAWRFGALTQLGITLYIDEAQYWAWAQHLDWGYFSKPPGVAALIAASTALLGDGLLGVKALAMLCYPASAWAGWAVARRLYGAETAAWAAATLLTLPLFAWLGLFVSTDALLILFWMLAIFAYLRALDDDAWKNWLLLGLLSGLGLMSKYPMAIWMLTALVHLALFHPGRLKSAKPWMAFLLALLLLSPNLFWNVAKDFPTLKHTADITIHKHASGGFSSLGEFLAAQWVAFGPVLGLAFAGLLVSGIRKPPQGRDARLVLLLGFSLPLWLIVCFQAWKTSANANWAAPAFAPATIALAAWLLQTGRRRWLAIGIAVNLALTGVVYHWPALLKALEVPEASRKDPFTRARGWDELGRQMHPFFAEHPGAVLVADNRTLLAHLVYELRALSPPVASWNPSGEKSDHFKLTTDLNAYRGHDLLFVTHEALPASVTAHFSRTTRLARLKAPLDETHDRNLELYLLHDFQGY